MTLKLHLPGRIAGMALLAGVGATGAASAERDPYIGQMTMIGQSWCAEGWAPMDGQLYDISSHTTLYALLGCRFGGDCRETFALPDMRGRTPVGYGTSPWGTPYQLGQKGGVEEVVMSFETMPAHIHRINASDRGGTSGEPAGRDLADFTGTQINGYTSSAPNDQIMAAETIEFSTGSSQPFSIRQPYQVINYCIAVDGVFPPRT